MRSDPARLWGSFSLAPNTHGEWRIGPLSMTIERAPREWIVATDVVADRLDESATFEARDGPMDEVARGSSGRLRCAASPKPETLLVTPALPDRAVVIRAEQPITLLPGDHASIFVGSPIWVQLALGARERQFADFPTLRPSDTWFGPSTREGELCYASKTGARTRLDGEPVRAARALTRVDVHNDGADPLVVERLKVPTAHLGLYRGTDGRVWTNTLSVTRDRAGLEVACRVETGVASEAGAATPLAVPRESNPGVIKRALHALIG